MSSKYVRDQVKNFIAAEYPTLKLVDFSAEYLEMSDILSEYSILPDDAWLGVQFVGDREEPTSISATNNQGRYREFGGFFIHLVEPIQRVAFDNILDRSETLIEKLRGTRLGEVVIESINPLNTAQGSTLEFSGGYISGSVFFNYYRDKNL